MPLSDGYSSVSSLLGGRSHGAHRRNNAHLCSWSSDFRSLFRLRSSIQQSTADLDSGSLFEFCPEPFEVSARFQNTALH